MALWGSRDQEDFVSKEVISTSRGSVETQKKVGRSKKTDLSLGEDSSGFERGGERKMRNHLEEGLVRQPGRREITRVIALMTKDHGRFLPPVLL